MSLKLRFALIFTLFVAIMLAISSVLIHLLYSNFREEEFYQRVKSEGVIFHDFVLRIKDPNEAAMAKMMSGVSTNSVFDEKLVVIDAQGKIVNKLPYWYIPRYDQALLDKIKRKGEFRFDENAYQSIGVYYKNSGYFTIATGYDLSGFRKMHNLEIILGVVFFGGIFLAGLISFIFVQQAIKPFLDLNNKIRMTTINNLAERLSEDKNYPEIMDIVVSYNAMLERLNKAFEFQKSFVQHASHELRTPLAIMLSQTESALSKPIADRDMERLLLSLKEEQQGMIELTNSLLLLTQYEQLGFQREWPETRIDESVFEAGSALMRLYEDAKVQIGFREIPESDESLIIIGNEALLKSVFLNLFRNAYLYANDKKVEASIFTDNDFVYVQVENRGETLSEEDAIKVMQPFFRGKNAIQLQTKGFGLGLAIVARILQAHGGQVHYDNPEAGLNRFTVFLPRANKAYPHLGA